MKHLSKGLLLVLSLISLTACATPIKEGHIVDKHMTENHNETITYSLCDPFPLRYRGPQLAGVDDSKWYDWEYKLRNTVIGLAYEQVNDVLSNIAHNHSGITVTELIKQLDRKEPTC